MRKENEAEIICLQESIEQFSEENERLKTDDEVDLEALIESSFFAPIKDVIEDAMGDELIRRIKEVHPELDLSFLTDGGVESSRDATKADGAVMGVGPVLKEAEAGRIHPDSALNSTIEGGSA